MPSSPHSEREKSAQATSILIPTFGSNEKKQSSYVNQTRAQTESSSPSGTSFSSRFNSFPPLRVLNCFNLSLNCFQWFGSTRLGSRTGRTKAVQDRMRRWWWTLHLFDKARWGYRDQTLLLLETCRDWTGARSLNCLALSRGSSSSRTALHCTA